MGMDLIDLVMKSEDAFGVGVSDEDAVGIETPGQLHEYIMMRLRAAERLSEPPQPGSLGVPVLHYHVKSPPRVWAEPEVWETVVSIVAEVAGVDPSRVKPDSHFVRDLGFD